MRTCVMLGDVLVPAALVFLVEPDASCKKKDIEIVCVRFRRGRHAMFLNGKYVGLSSDRDQCVMFLGELLENLTKLPGRTVMD